MASQDEQRTDSENPLLELAPDTQEELITAWEDYQSENDTTNVRRRGFLQAGAAILAGTAVGGGAYALSSEEVAAAANEVGQIGEPGNLVDVYGEDVSAVSVDTDELTDVARFIEAGTSRADINTELATAGTVVFKSGNHYVSDTLEVGANGVRIIVAEGAHVKLADTASPTLVTDQQNTDHAVLFRNQGYNNVSFINRGNVDANNTNHTNPIQFLWEDGHHGYINSEGGRLTGGGGGVWAVDSDNLRIPSLHMKGPGDGTGAPLNMEGCRHATVDYVKAVDAGEVVDLNAYNEDCTFGIVHGHNLSGGNEVIDINASPRTTVGRVLGTGTVDGLLTIQGNSGNRFSSRTDPGHSNGCKIQDMKGVVGNRAVYHVGGESKNLKLRNLDVESTSSNGYHAVELQPGASNALDGLVVSGEIRQTGNARGLQVGSGNYVQNGVHVDAEVYSGSTYSASFDNVKNVTGELRCYGASYGPQLYANQTIDGHRLTIRSEGGTNKGFILSGSGSITGQFDGVVKGWSTDVEVGSVGSSVRLNIDYGTLTDNGTGTVKAQYA